MKDIKLTINGKEVTTSSGKTILEAVEDNKLDKIPTLCHDPRIEPYGSCFLCVVQVEGMNKLVPSCCTPVNDGMVIETDNKRIRSSRKTALELLMSNHYADCIGPCTNNCPAHVDAQGYIALISKGKYREALKLIKQQNPLPLSIGRVCVRDCEVACRRQIIDQPVGINYMKRFVADTDANQEHRWIPPLEAAKNKRVAVVGGGPSGLTCAYYLTLEGYQVTIFEKQARLGGMLMYGIPQYRLPKEILDNEIQWITDLGVEVKTCRAMGRDFTIQSLLADGFDSVYVAVGAHKASTMRLEHENDTDGVLGGIDFLRQLPDQIPQLSGTVVVVGGGNTAIDAARTALRCGAEQVKIVYRRSLNEMPAHHEEIDAAQEEGIEILFLTNPTAIQRDKENKLTGITCIKMQLEAAAPGERPRPVPVEGSEFHLPCGYLISAIGQQVDTEFNEGNQPLRLERWGTITVEEKTLATSVKGVFAGGDAVTGPDTAINAIAQGKRAALAIANYLNPQELPKPLTPFYSFKHRFAEIPESEFSHIAKAPRNQMNHLPSKQRIDNFSEVETGYNGSQCHAEAGRCIECGCGEYYDCQLRQYSDQYDIDVNSLLGEVRKYKVDRTHPFISIDANKCIDCGRCVRTCNEILRVSALGFVHRGFKAVVKPAMEKTLLETNCIACGNCIDTCPTGALSEKLPFKVMGTLPKENYQTVCNFCSLGCHINVKVIDDHLFYISNAPEVMNPSPNDGYLCVKGRFGHNYLMNREDRHITPMIKDNGGLRSCDWETAVDTIAQRVNKVIDIHGLDAVAIMASPKRSNEELYLLQKLARAGLKTNNIGSFTRLALEGETGNLDRHLGFTASTVTLKDIETADVVVVINGNLSPENLVMELKIKQAQKKHGTKLILIDSSEVKLAKYADLWVDSRKGTNTVLLNGIIHHMIRKGFIDQAATGYEGYSEMAETVSRFDDDMVVETTGIQPETYRQLIDWLLPLNRKVVFIYNTDSLRERSLYDLEAIGNLLMLSGRFHPQNTTDQGGILLMGEFANSAGLSEMGASPDYLPGFVKPEETGEIQRIGSAWGVNLEPVFSSQETTLKEKLLQGQIKALLVFGEDPLASSQMRKYFTGIEFLMVSDLFHTASTDEADVIIPATSFLEQEGTFTSCHRDTQPAPKILSPVSGIDNYRFIQMLAKRFHMNMDYDSVSAIGQEIETVNRFHNDFKPEVTPGFSFRSHDTGTAIFSSDVPVPLYSENFFATLRMHLTMRN